MDKVIFNLRFLCKLLLVPTIGNVLKFHSPETDTYLFGMDSDMYLNRIASLPKPMVKAVCVERTLSKVWCEYSYFDRSEGFPEINTNITEVQMADTMQMMSFVLFHHSSSGSDDNAAHCFRLLLLLAMALFASCRRKDIEVWLKEHMSELIAFRSDKGDSALHLLTKLCNYRFPKVPIVRLIVESEVGNMNINAQNFRKKTALHFLSEAFRNQANLSVKEQKDLTDSVELIVNNGAHMDMVDVEGREASRGLPKISPRYAFNFSLKCLAAKVIARQGIHNQEIVPKTIVPFIQAHDSGS